MLKIPVIFLVFNRPELTARVFARIREARPTKLLVVADGPRSDRPGEAEKCQRVRELIERGIDWPCELVRDYSETNLGCGRRVSSGITNAFKQVEEAIILEDDCLPDPTFFRFCAELLQHYRTDERIGHICGANFQRGVQRGEASYYFSRYPHCWGWATWRRAWQHYDHEMKAWPANTRMLCLTTTENRHWRRVFTATKRERIDSWGYRWVLAFWQRDFRSIVPGTNLVSNLGFGPSATHTSVSAFPLANLPVTPLSFPLIHPASTSYNDDADESTARLFFKPHGWRARARDAWDMLVNDWLGRNDYGKE